MAIKKSVAFGLVALVRKPVMKAFHKDCRAAFCALAMSTPSVCNRACGELVQLLPQWRFVTHYTGTLWLLHLPSRYIPLKVMAFTRFMMQALQTPAQ